ncbi:Lon proteolytic domain-containing protein [Caenorhabditis elegans]|uniref:Lon proteolytic domain-containing protein n=1 Tax=Caenorhabditis elegans TaxID=6239 RepID=A0A486WVR8_CAEEL|nr:Lon proteolytic domain-containing protein [Caenorhabditis elegans]VGM69585.1 Lon proteolytic domain-containing protein [Caenorhabditis elegans]
MVVSIISKQSTCTNTVIMPARAGGNPSQLNTSIHATRAPADPAIKSISKLEFGKIWVNGLGVIKPNGEQKTSAEKGPIVPIFCTFFKFKTDSFHCYALESIGEDMKEGARLAYDAVTFNLCSMGVSQHPREVGDIELKIDAAIQNKKTIVIVPKDNFESISKDMKAQINGVPVSHLLEAFQVVSQQGKKKIIVNCSHSFFAKMSRISLYCAIEIDQK